MKTKFTLLLLLLSLIGYAQNGINYKAVVKDDLGNVWVSDLVQIQFNILKGAALTNVYSETHTETTDNNGIIIVNIGEGTLVSGSADYNTIDWASDTHFLQVLINTGGGFVDMVTSEFKAVPYAITSGDKSWESEIDNVHVISKNVGIGTNTPTELIEIYDIDNAGLKLTVPSLGDTSKIEFRNGVETGGHAFYKIENRSDLLRFELDTDLGTATGFENKMTLSNTGLAMQNGSRINEFSSDGTLSGNSNFAVPTEQAVKTYVDNNTPVLFKVRGNGFAVKDIDGETEVETDIWDIEIYDTANAFNTTTDRFVVPSSGYYFLHAVVDQSNFVTPAFFRLRFNVDPASLYSTIVDGDDVRTEVSGIYFLSAGQEVYVLLRNFSAGEDERMDGTGSWFEGYKL